MGIVTIKAKKRETALSQTFSMYPIRVASFQLSWTKLCVAANNNRKIVKNSKTCFGFMALSGFDQYFYLVCGSFFEIDFENFTFLRLFFQHDLRYLVLDHFL